MSDDNADPEGRTGGGGAFFRAVRDPAGSEFHIQAASAGISSPAVIGTDSVPFPTKGALGFVNRLLISMQRPRRGRSKKVVLLVTRIERDAREAAHFEEAPTMAEARQRGLALAHEIEAGTLKL